MLRNGVTGLTRRKQARGPRSQSMTAVAFYPSSSRPSNNLSMFSTSTYQFTKRTKRGRRRLVGIPRGGRSWRKPILKGMKRRTVGEHSILMLTIPAPLSRYAKRSRLLGTRSPKWKLHQRRRDRRRRLTTRPQVALSRATCAPKACNPCWL